jgi:hypothetical protein
MPNTIMMLGLYVTLAHITLISNYTILFLYNQHLFSLFLQKDFKTTFFCHTSATKKEKSNILSNTLLFINKNKYKLKITVDFIGQLVYNNYKEKSEYANTRFIPSCD